nr:hypothetical protein [Burkholderia ambifaria]
MQTAIVPNRHIRQQSILNAPESRCKLNGAMRIEVSSIEFAKMASCTGNIVYLRRYRLKNVLPRHRWRIWLIAEPSRIYAHKVVSARRVGKAEFGRFRVISPLVRLPHMAAGVFRMPQLYRS